MLVKNKKNIIYVRYDTRKYESASEKIIKFLRKVLIRVEIETIENGQIILIPKYKKNNNFIKNRLLKQVKNLLEDKEFQGLIYEKDLFSFKDEIGNILKDKKQNKVKNKIKDRLDSIQILNGKYLMKNMLKNILKYIFDINKQNMSLENIYIFVNEYTKDNIYIINSLIAKFKTVNIITENLRYYKRLEMSLYKEGILINVSNNKKKSARYAKYIVNIDFEKEIFEKYNINMNSVIINLTNNERFFDNIFRGVLVNNFDVHINQDDWEFIKEFYGNIYIKVYLEGYLKANMVKYNYVENVCAKYGVIVYRLIGLHGALKKEEFERIK